VIRELANVASQFILGRERHWDELAWRNPLSDEPRNGLIHATQFLVRTRQIEVLKQIAGTATSPRAQEAVLRLAGPVAIELADEYAAALAAQNDAALWGLIPVLRALPEAVTLVRRHGVKAVHTQAIRVGRVTEGKVALKAIRQQCPALALELYGLIMGDNSEIEHGSGLDALHGSGENPIQAILTLNHAVSIAA
jgi:hypothetical protein